MKKGKATNNLVIKSYAIRIYMLQQSNGQFYLTHKISFKQLLSLQQAPLKIQNECIFRADFERFDFSHLHVNISSDSR